MPVSIVRQDITKIKADAIVSASGHSFSGHGMVASAIFDAAGPGLQLECNKKGFLDTAETLVTGAYQLPAKKVVHTVGPEFKDGHSGEALLLAQCYRNCMDSAWEAGCRSIAFPLISSGGYRFPKENALSTAMEAIASSEHADEMDVTLAVYDRSSYEVSRDLLEDIRNYLGNETEPDHLVNEEQEDLCLKFALEREDRESREGLCLGSGPEDMEECAPPSITHEKRRSVRRSASRGTDGMSFACVCGPEQPKNRQSDTSENRTLSPRSEKEMLKDLKEAMSWRDESFAECILRMMDEREMKPSACYGAANISKAVFSNIVNKKEYKPTKATAFAFAIGLKLDLAQTRELLAKAGYAMSDSFPFDRVMKYFIEHRLYNVGRVNELLFELDLPLLGEKSD